MDHNRGHFYSFYILLKGSLHNGHPFKVTICIITTLTVFTGDVITIKIISTIVDFLDVRLS